MKKREAAFNSLFNRWLRVEWTQSEPAAFELKRTIKESLPFSALAEHQKQSLCNVEDAGLIYKIPDDSISYKPFDCFYLKGRGYVVVSFGAKIDEFFIIPIMVWVHEEKTSKRRSLTRERAREIGGTIAVGRKL